MNNVIDLVARRKIEALDKNITELTEVTTAIKTAMQALTKFNHYSNIRHQVNELFVLYREVKTTQEKKLQILERLKNEQTLE